MARVLVPLPDRDFDITEVSVPWKLLTEAKHDVVFATENGAPAACDPLLVTGVVFGQLGAAPEPLAFYRELEPLLQAPMPWSAVEAKDFDALLMPGGHAPGMRQYLGSEALQDKLRAFEGKPIAAICHGTIPLARAGMLKDKTTTCLPKYMERLAYFLTAWKLGRYYRTYDAYVEDEVRAACKGFVRGPRNFGARGTRDDDGPAFVVEDGTYVSARWPGDAYLFAKKFLERL